MAGQEQGMNIYERASVAAGTMVSISLSGTAPPPAAASASQAGGAPGRAENVQGGDARAIQSVPGRLDEYEMVAGGRILRAVRAGGDLAVRRKPVAVTVLAPDHCDRGIGSSTTSQARRGVEKCRNASTQWRLHWPRSTVTPQQPGRPEGPTVPAGIAPAGRNHQRRRIRARTRQSRASPARPGPGLSVAAAADAPSACDSKKWTSATARSTRCAR